MMKTLKTLIAAAALATLTIGSASALTLDTIASPAKVRVTVNNGVATLYGNVENNFERLQAAKAAAKIEGVERVRNLLIFSN